MALQYAGTMTSRKDLKPLMAPVDSKIKKAMKSAMTRGREHGPMMPYPKKEVRKA